MIVKGKSCAHAGNLANYLVRKGKNDLVRVLGTDGTVSQDLGGALQEMKALAELTQCENFLYHASIRPKDGEQLTPEQWERAVDILEKELKLEGHQRAVVEHVKDGTAHYHVIWNRIDPERLQAQNMGWNYVHHEKAERQMEEEFGLEHVQGRFVLEHGERPAERGPTQGQVKQAKRDGVDLYQWREEIRAIEKGTGTAPELIEALEAKGYLVARGDKVAFMLLDPAGHPQRMAQSLGLKVKELRERLDGIDPENLPTVEQAQELARVRSADLTAAQEVMVPFEREGADEAQAVIAPDAIREAETEEQRRAAAEAEEARRKEQEGQSKGTGWASHMAATLYNRAGMEATQRDALKHHQDKQRAFEAAHEEAGPHRPEAEGGAPRERDRRELLDAKQRQAEREKAGQEERQREERKARERVKQEATACQMIAEATQREEREKQEHQRDEQTKTRRTEEQREAVREVTRPNPGGQRLDETRARTEQTDAAQRQDQIMREIFEQKFGTGRSPKDRESWERERERER